MAKKGRKQARGRVRGSRATARAARRNRVAPLRDPAVRRASIDVTLPADATAAEHADAQHHLDTMDANRQIAREDGALPPGATHQIQTGPGGKKKLVRKRFSAT